MLKAAKEKKKYFQNLKSHFPLIRSDAKTKLYNLKGSFLPESIRKITWGDLSHSMKIATSLIPATVAGLAIPFMNKRWNRVVPSLLAAYGQSVGLVGVKDMYDELHKNLGVKLTLPRTYQILSTLGYLINTISQLKFLNTGVGRVFFGFNLIFTYIYSYMLYLTMTYNRRLETPVRMFEGLTTMRRNKLNLPALIAWIAVILITMYVWFVEGKASLTSTYKNEILASLGFLLVSIGNVRAGFRAATSSNAEITPFVGAATSAVASLLSLFSLIPLWSKSPIARIYVAGNAAVIYSVLLNAFYSLRKERNKKNVEKKKASTQSVLRAKL
jgi:hypothetical protein